MQACRWALDCLHKKNSTKKRCNEPGDEGDIPLALESNTQWTVALKDNSDQVANSVRCYI